MNDKLIAQNKARWAKAIFKPKALKTAASVAKRLVAAKDKYVSVSNKTGVPWFIIAVIHEREASQRWDRSIAQGDPWAKTSIHVPQGRGPFTSWEAAAVDALTNCGPYASKWSDWSAGGSLTLLELYNGLGYFKKGLPSPYIWSGTDQYVCGKYVSDGKFDPSAVDQQLGCVVVIKAMAVLDPSISFEPIPEPVQPVPAPTPQTAPAAPKSDEDDTPSAPKAGPVGDATGAKPLIKSKTMWSSIAATAATVGSYMASVSDFLTDWRTLAVLVAVAALAYIVWERNGKPDIRGWFK